MSILVPPIPITLDKPRALKFNFNALSMLTLWSGKNLLKQQNPLSDGTMILAADGKEKEVGVINPDGLRCALAALLLHEDPTMTPAKAGELIGIENLAEISTKVAAAIGNFFAPADSQPADPQQAQNPT